MSESVAVACIFHMHLLNYSLCRKCIIEHNVNNKKKYNIIKICYIIDLKLTPPLQIVTYYLKFFIFWTNVINYVIWAKLQLKCSYYFHIISIQTHYKEEKKTRVKSKFAFNEPRGLAPYTITHLLFFCVTNFTKGY